MQFPTNELLSVSIVAHNFPGIMTLSFYILGVNTGVCVRMNAYGYDDLFHTFIQEPIYLNSSHCFVSQSSTEGPRRASLPLTVWPANEPRSCVSLRATPTSLWTVSRTLETGAWEWPSHYDCSCMERYKPPAHIVCEWMNACCCSTLGSLKHVLQLIFSQNWWIMKCYYKDYKCFFSLFLVFVITLSPCILGGWQHHRKGENSSFNSPPQNTAYI